MPDRRASRQPGTWADKGFAVTLYEASPSAGGMLLWGIPAYRLPKDILAYEVDLIRRKGVKIVLNCRIGPDKTGKTMEALRKENAAVFISAGAHMSRKLGVPGEEKPGVDFGVEFLRQAGSDNKPKVGSRVLVIGGGNVAVDVARTALRLGAKQVEMVSLEKRDEMPAYKEEIAATLAEGIKIHNGWGPKRILGDGGVTGIELKECTRVFDENRRFSPAYNESNLKTIDADQIIVAIGQAVNPDLLNHCDLTTGRGCFTRRPCDPGDIGPGDLRRRRKRDGTRERYPGRGRGGKGPPNRSNATSTARTSVRTALPTP